MQKTDRGNGAQGAVSGAMSSYESIYKKMSSSLERNRDGSLRESTSKYDPARHVAPVVAHELNNILTIVQGYAERLLLRHGDDPELAPHLKLISEASKRAAAVVRDATPPDANNMFRQQQKSQPAPVAA
jgi:signal transduction histidine kinase